MELAVISNEATPYRLHVLGRIADEIPEVRLHSIFTHSLTGRWMPWNLEPEAKINPWIDEDLHLNPGRAFESNSIALYRRIRDYLVENKIQVVILLGYDDITRFLLIRWAHRAGVPLLMNTDSNVFSEGRISILKRMIKRLYLRWVVSRVAGLMPMGTCGRAYYRLYSNRDRPVFLHPYEPDYETLRASTEEERESCLRKHGLPAGRNRFLYCGRLVKVKRVRDLVEAFTLVAPERPDWDLVIVGDGKMRERLEAMVPASLKDRVRFLGFVQFEDAVPLYHSCQVLVHPSEYEPWGLIINEAVACGLAVVTTEVVGAAVELVKHRVNGLIVPPRDPAALAAAMEEASLDGRWREMGERGPAMLDLWREQADPVEGVRQAVRHFAP